MERAKLRESITRLRELTADNPSQHGAINRAGEAIEQQVALLDRAMEKAESAKQSGGPQEVTGVISTDDGLTRMMDAFERDERRLFADRSGSVQNGAQWTLQLLLIAGVFSCGALLLAGYYIQREILSRGRSKRGYGGPAS